MSPLGVAVPEPYHQRHANCKIRFAGIEDRGSGRAGWSTKACTAEGRRTRTVPKIHAAAQAIDIWVIAVTCPASSS